MTPNPAATYTRDTLDQLANHQHQHQHHAPKELNPWH